MKKIFTLILLTNIIFSCSKKNESDISPIIKPNPIQETTPAYLKGSILGQDIVLQEKQGGYKGTITEFYNSATPSVPAWNGIKLVFDTDSTQGHEFIINTSYIPTGNKREVIEKIFERGLKKIDEKSTTSMFERDKQPYQDFVIEYITTDKNKSRRYYCTTGNQDGSSLEVLESTPIRPIGSFIYALQIKFRINLKLYNYQGQYMGKITDTEFLIHYYYN